MRLITVQIADPASPLVGLDCDGGGINNEVECFGPDGLPGTPDDPTTPGDPLAPGDDACQDAINNSIDICMDISMNGVNSDYYGLDCDGGGVNNEIECFGPDGLPGTPDDPAAPGDPLAAADDACQDAINNGIDVCAAMLADPASPLFGLDCDGGGVNNEVECFGPDGLPGGGDDPAAPTDPLAAGDDCQSAIDNAVDICAIVLADPTNGLAGADCDNGGVANYIECTNGLDPLNPADDPECASGIPDKDGDGVPDLVDIDDDNDGIPDTVEGLVQECSTPDFSSVNGSTSAVADVNASGITVGGATLTLSQAFNGTGTLDENSVNSSQTTGDVGISQGVDNSAGPADNIVTTYSFSQPVCGQTVDVWDIDQTDQMTFEAFNGGTPVTYTVDFIGSCVAQAGNTFTPNGAACEVQVSGVLAHSFTATFDDCIDEIVITYADQGTAVGTGGSYTIVFDEGCTITQTVDTDGDGIPDHLDQDSDNDGIADAVEACGDNTLVLEDCSLDSDGSLAYPDNDGDGCPDGLAITACAGAPIDTDGDGVPDYLDLDSDNDGCSDAAEAATDAITGINNDPVAGYANPAAAVDACGLVLDAGTGVCVTPATAEWIDDQAQSACDPCVDAANNNLDICAEMLARATP